MHKKCRKNQCHNIQSLEYQQWRNQHFFTGGTCPLAPLRGVTPSKTHRFWHICLLPIEKNRPFSSIFLFFSIFSLVGGKIFYRGAKPLAPWLHHWWSASYNKAHLFISYFNDSFTALIRVYSVHNIKLNRMLWKGRK